MTRIDPQRASLRTRVRVRARVAANFANFRALEMMSRGEQLGGKGD
ncbi:MAG TPA: hypothetical protein VM308_09895 [Sphingomicrobium sp.]|nr:hypothetical protein [Sphingomicrobium sp.]